jgi:hypothetical protein
MLQLETGSLTTSTYAYVDTDGYDLIVRTNPESSLWAFDRNRIGTNEYTIRNYLNLKVIPRNQSFWERSLREIGKLVQEVNAQAQVACTANRPPESPDDEFCLASKDSPPTTESGKEWLLEQFLYETKKDVTSGNTESSIDVYDEDDIENLMAYIEVAIDNSLHMGSLFSHSAQLKDMLTDPESIANIQGILDCQVSHYWQREYESWGQCSTERREDNSPFYPDNYSDTSFLPKMYDEWANENSLGYASLFFYGAPDIICESIKAGMDPLWILTIWMHESNASDYGCAAGNPQSCTVDFGADSVGGNFEMRFNSQLGYILFTGRHSMLWTWSANPNDDNTPLVFWNWHKAAPVSEGDLLASFRDYYNPVYGDSRLDSPVLLRVSPEILEDQMVDGDYHIAQINGQDAHTYSCGETSAPHIYLENYDICANPLLAKNRTDLYNHDEYLAAYEEFMSLEGEEEEEEEEIEEEEEEEEEQPSCEEGSCCNYSDDFIGLCINGECSDSIQLLNQCSQLEDTGKYCTTGQRCGYCTMTGNCASLDRIDLTPISPGLTCWPVQAPCSCPGQDGHLSAYEECPEVVLGIGDPVRPGDPEYGKFQLTPEECDRWGAILYDRGLSDYDDDNELGCGYDALYESCFGVIAYDSRHGGGSGGYGNAGIIPDDGSEGGWDDHWDGGEDDPPNQTDGYCCGIVAEGNPVDNIVGDWEFDSDSYPGVCYDTWEVGGTWRDDTIAEVIELAVVPDSDTCQQVFEGTCCVREGSAQWYPEEYCNMPIPDLDREQCSQYNDDYQSINITLEPGFNFITWDLKHPVVDLTTEDVFDIDENIILIAQFKDGVWKKVVAREGGSIAGEHFQLWTNIPYLFITEEETVINIQGVPKKRIPELNAEGWYFISPVIDGELLEFDDLREFVNNSDYNFEQSATFNPLNQYFEYYISEDRYNEHYDSFDYAHGVFLKIKSD